MLVCVSSWRRFERASRSESGRFWAIRVVARDCEIRFGQIGGDETEERLEHASETEAARVARQKIRTKQRAGWVEVEPVDDARQLALEQGEALEQAIAADPSNLDNWAVYADWLQAIEPLVGERVALGLELARTEPNRKRAKMQARIDELERTHARELFGVTLAGVLTERKLDGMVVFGRQLGMIVSASLHEPDSAIVKVDALLGALLDLPLARLLLELRIDIHPENLTFVNVVETFMARRHTHLRQLTLGANRSYEAPRQSQLPGIPALLDGVPNIEELALHGPFPGNASHPSLRMLTLTRGYRAPKWTLPQWELPALSCLRVHGPGPVEWSTVDLPRLRELSITRPSHGDKLVESLARAPLLDQLDTLVLLETDLTDRGVRTILAQADRFASVDTLAILGVAANPGHIAALQAALPHIQIETRAEEWADR
jgi:predicted DNA-binding WGR domain protein